MKSYNGGRQYLSTKVSTSDVSGDAGINGVSIPLRTVNAHQAVFSKGGFKRQESDALEKLIDDMGLEKIE